MGWLPVQPQNAPRFFRRRHPEIYVFHFYASEVRHTPHGIDDVTALDRLAKHLRGEGC